MIDPKGSRYRSSRTPQNVWNIKEFLGVTRANNYFSFNVSQGERWVLWLY